LDKRFWDFVLNRAFICDALAHLNEYYRVGEKVKRVIRVVENEKEEIIPF
jgi:hypothetical protein